MHVLYCFNLTRWPLGSPRQDCDENVFRNCRILFANQDRDLVIMSWQAIVTGPSQLQISNLLVFLTNVSVHATYHFLRHTQSQPVFIKQFPSSLNFRKLGFHLILGSKRSSECSEREQEGLQRFQQFSLTTKLVCRTKSKISSKRRNENSTSFYIKMVTTILAQGEGREPQSRSS